MGNSFIMNDENTNNFIFHDEFLTINKSFEEQLDIRCMDLHSIQLALTNITDRQEFKVPSTYVSYFLKKTPTDFPNEFVSYTKGNIELMLARINNYFAQNILNSAEKHLIDGLTLLRTIQLQTAKTISSESFKVELDKERSKNRTFGTLGGEIKARVAKLGGNIIEENCPYYSFLENYVILRNCFTHRGGRITEKENELEIRLPFISEEQLEKAKKARSSGPISPQTVIRKWELDDTIELNLHEVEGIAYGALKTLSEVMRHMYKAADRHVAKLE
jgi:hypothetical protein